MYRPFQDSDWLLEKQPPHHFRLAVLALAVSLGAHGLLLNRLPSVRLTRIWEAARERVRPPVAVHEVRHETPPPVDRPPVFEPEKPDGSFTAHPAPREFVSAFDPVLLEPPPRRTDLMGEQTPLREPAPPPRRDDWLPRQERLEIDRKLIREEIPQLPRRILPDIERVPDAPDIAPPSPPPVQARAPAPPPGPPVPLPDFSLSGAAGGGGRHADPPSTPGSPAAPVVGAPVRIEDVARIFSERPREVTDIKPIEQLLQLDLAGFIPPDEPAYRYFSLEIRRRGAEALPVLPKDVLIVQDCSESMTQPKLDDCKRGLFSYLRTLDPADRFDVMSFRERQERCFGDWKPATIDYRARAGWFIEQMVSQGRTDIYGSLAQMASLAPSADRPVIALMVSDGRPTIGLQDNFEIIQKFADQNAGRVSTFSFGGGTRVNRFLLDFLSFKNRGDSIIVRDRSQIPDALAGLAVELSRPVLAGLRYRFSGIDDQDVYPKLLTHLFLDRPLVIFGRAPASAPPAGIQVLGQSGSRHHDMVFRIEWSKARAAGESLRTKWRWQKLNWMVGEHIRTRDPSLVSEIQKLAASLGPDLPYGADLGIPGASVRAD